MSSSNSFTTLTSGRDQAITGIILAGGKSSRMGKNKALLQINGMKNIERIKNSLEKMVGNVIVVANDKNSYHFLHVPIVEDIYKDMGPLGGIHSGLLASGTDWNFFAACDLPFFNMRIGREMIPLTTGTVQAIVPKIKGKIHPLFALYHQSILSTITESLEQNKLRMTKVLAQLNVHYVTEKDLLAKGFGEEEIEQAFYNMNLPEDYQRIMKSWSEEGD